MFCNFQTTTHGKWILAGEHTVIRGGEALVFPIRSKELTLQYQPASSELNAHYEGDCGADTHLLFWSVLEQGMQLLGRSLNSLSGHFDLHSNIPVGVGMGASAALCVAMARWFEAQQLLESHQVNQFAKELEHLFHGKSSGLDIAGVSTESGLVFKQGSWSPLKPSWNPHWYLSSCGQIGITSHCIQQVQTLWDQNPDQAEHIDVMMSKSVQLAKKALAEETADSLAQLTQAIDIATDCFFQWGLISESLQHHMQALRDAGALAVKPTGSGGGGYVVSLWKKPPPKMVVELIEI